MTATFGNVEGGAENNAVGAGNDDVGTKNEVNGVGNDGKGAGNDDVGAGVRMGKDFHRGFQKSIPSQNGQLNIFIISSSK